MTRHLGLSSGQYIHTLDGATLIENVAQNELVWTRNGTLQLVEDCISTEYVGNLSHIRSVGGWHISCDPKQRILTRNGWICARDIVTNPADVEVFVPKPDLGVGKHLGWGTSLSWFAGLWSGVGFVNDDRTTLYLDTHLLEDTSCEQALGTLTSATVDRRVSVWQITNTNLIRTILDNCGKTTAEKHIPVTMYQAEKQIQAAFFRGYYAAVGIPWWNDRTLKPKYILTCPTPQLAYGMRLLLLNLDIFSNIQQRTNLTWELSFVRSRAANKLFGHEQPVWQRPHYTTVDDGWFIPVHEALTVPYKGFLYNLEVHNNAPYVGGFAIHT